MRLVNLGFKKTRIMSEGADVVNGLEAVMLGKPAIFWQSKRVIFPFSKMEALLYYLLVKGNATREEVAGLLWGDMDDVTAKKNLRNTLYLLKKLIPGEILLTPSRSLILINPNVVKPTDVQQFESGLQKSLDLWRGEFLEGFFCKEAELLEEWVREQRERLRETYTSRLTKHIIELMKEKKYSDAKYFLKRLIDIDEYNESAHRALMRIYEGEGAFSKITEAYLKLAKKIASELGITPNYKTKEIYNRIHKKKILDTVICKNTDNEWFYGRDKELNRLFKLLDDFRTGRAIKQFVVLYGEQGVGKSTLMKKFIETAPNRDELLLKTQCYEPEANYPYKAWSTIFCQVMEVLLEEGITIPALWQQVISYIFPSALPLDDWEEKNSFFDAQGMQPGAIDDVMCGILGKLAKSRRIVMLIEDIHWMDMQGLSVLKGFLRLYGCQVVCVSTCRSEHLESLNRVLGDLSANVVTECLAVERFNREDVIGFSALVLTPDKIKPGVQQKLYEYTNGNALFLVECFKLIQMGQDIGSLSPRLQSVFNARMINFSAKSQKVLAVASIFFREATYDALANVCGFNELELVEAIEEILQNKLMVEMNSMERKGIGYKFSHALIRDYIYSKMSLARQKMIHLQIAGYLEERMSTDYRGRDLYSAVLYHYSKAGEKYKVLEYTIKITEKFSSPHYEMFPEINDDQTCHGSTFEDRLLITNYLQQISVLLKSVPEEVEGGKSLCRYKAAYLELLGQYYIWRGEHRKGIKVIHELLRLALAKEYSDYLIKGYQQIVYCGIQTHNHKLIEKFATKLLKKANELNLKEKMATALRFLGLAHAMQKDNITAELYYRQSITLLRRLAKRTKKYAPKIGAAYNYIGDIRRATNNLSEALQYYEKAIHLYSQHNVGEALSIIYINAGHIAFELGDYEKARTYLEEAFRVSKKFRKQMGYWCLRSQCTLNCILALIAVREGKPTEGLKYLKRADRFFEKHNDWYESGLALRVKTEVSVQMNSDMGIEKVFAEYLPLSGQEYYQRSKAIFCKLGDAYQIQALDRIFDDKKNSLI